MVLIDYSHLQARNMYIAIVNAKPRKVNGKLVTEEFIKMFYHQMLASLRLISRSFKDYGEIVICVDARSYWRKDIYSEYKGHRKKDRDESDIDFDEFHAFAGKFLQVLEDEFPYTVVRADKAEADDIIGILAKHFAKTENTICVSSDKDMKQILEYGAELYDPITKKHVNMTAQQLKEWKIEHILCGDDGDNIPHIKRGTLFTPAFLTHLKNNDIHLKDSDEGTIVEQFENLSIADHLYSTFDVWRETKKDGKFKDIFKPTPFGPEGAKKFNENLAENLKSNKIYSRNFARNKELVLFSSIPSHIEEAILQAYNNVEYHYSSKNMLQFVMSNGLKEHAMAITEFEVAASKYKKSSSLVDEWT